MLTNPTTQIVEINDGDITYAGGIKGEWSFDQILQAFIDGYYTGNMKKGEKITIQITKATIKTFCSGMERIALD